MNSSPLPSITAFKASPDRGRGLARDMRVRWAFEEVGQKYDVQLVTFDEMKQPAYRKLQPFGQIPAYREGDLVLFETGAVILHIAETHAGLLPKDPAKRAHVISWMFASLNTIESPIVEREGCVLTEKDKPWYQDRMPILDARVTKRLQELSTLIGDSKWIAGEFSAADILLVTVLRRIQKSELFAPYANLQAYVERAEARPAYQRAFQAQLEVYNATLAK